MPLSCSGLVLTHTNTAFCSTCTHTRASAPLPNCDVCIHVCTYQLEEVIQTIRDLPAQVCGAIDDSGDDITCTAEMIPLLISSMAYLQTVCGAGGGGGPGVNCLQTFTTPCCYKCREQLNVMVYNLRLVEVCLELTEVSDSLLPTDAAAWTHQHAHRAKADHLTAPIHTLCGYLVCQL